MNKSELIQHLEEENRKYEAFLAQIGPDRMDQPGVAGHWSVKDIVAHVADWRKRTVAAPRGGCTWRIRASAVLARELAHR